LSGCGELGDCGDDGENRPARCGCRAKEEQLLNILANTAGSRWYWLALLALGLALEATALYYQYVLDYGPCVLCIHVRILVLGLVLVALLTLAVRGSRGGRVAAHLVVTLLLAGLVQRAWLLLGIERGFIEGECSFDLGLPPWLPLDHWLPVLFRVHEACGYTPALPLGFTMAELLLPVSILLLLLSIGLLLMALSSLHPRKTG
jgi:disulfide bond formation protein DsbB